MKKLNSPSSPMLPSKSTSPRSHQNPSKPLPKFLYKVIIVFVLVALLPIFTSSQAPELPNRSISTRSWELLHLLLVGIAISYGLFSGRNANQEIEKEVQLKTDMPQSYVSQLSSVFDEEEIQSPKGLGFVDETQNQTWNYSQYYREEPMVLVAEETTKSANITSKKPVFMSVRSLKSTDSETDEVGKAGGKESVVLPSPIPWRSRSGRMVIKEESFPPPCPTSNSTAYAEFGPSRSPSFRSPSPKRPSPSPSLSQEITGKIIADLVRKKSLHKSSPPPPPPPPPPPFGYSSHFINEKKDDRGRIKDELEDIKRRERGVFVRGDDLGSDSFNSEKDPYIQRSVRRVRPKEALSLPPLPRNQREKKDEFKKKMIITSDSESDDNGEFTDVEEASNSASPTEAPSEENEVDKKADEFIAKFREQIRLQRIASIQKSTGQRNTTASK